MQDFLKDCLVIKILIFPNFDINYKTKRYQSVSKSENMSGMKAVML